MNPRGLKIVIKSIPPEKQRYDTAGDYWEDKDGVIQVRVSKQRSEYEEFAIALHELVEGFLCKKRGISWDKITKFDRKFNDSVGEYNEFEPGDSTNAPYKKEHRFAENLERQFIHELGIDWLDYNERI